LVIVGFLAPYIIPLPFLFLETFVGFIQAFIFAMLTLVFVAMAVSGHEEHAEAHAH
jgi:F-type H+-transporting ATPase subunit a